MIMLDCPWCGRRDEGEFAYRGDATKRRPDGAAGEDAFYDYAYVRANPRGWHLEWWQHAAGCRQVLKVLRHTATHAVRKVAPADAEVEIPPA